MDAGAPAAVNDAAGTSFQRANLTDVGFTDADLTSANLNAASVSGAIWNGVMWDDTVCPDGSNSNHDGHSCVNNL